MMIKNLPDTTPEVLERVLALVHARVADAQRAAVDSFVREYLRHIDPEDLAERDAADLYGASLSHWNLAARRETGTARVRVFNPRLEEHGWQSTHTVIEIVNDDMPFLVDSVTMEVNRHDLTLHFIVHPIFSVVRDREGQLVAVAPHATPLPDAHPESLIHVEIDRVADAATLAELQANITRVLSDVRSAVTDWQPMLARLREIIVALNDKAPPLPAGDVAEGRAFLKWLENKHFTLLAYRCHDLVTQNGVDGLTTLAGTGLGLLRAKGEDADKFMPLPEFARAMARAPELLVITKSNSRSTVHRPGYLDYIGIKRFNERGQICGEHRFLGLYTSIAYSDSPEEIPLLRRKTSNVIARAGLAPGGHAGKALRNILAVYPRDELLQINEDELFATAMGILQLGERQRFRMFVRRDPFERFLACLIYVPQKNYSTELRRKWQAILSEAFDGTGSEYDVAFSESMMARVLMTVRTTPGAIPAYNVREIEARLAAAARSWDDDLKAALLQRYGEARGLELARNYAGAFAAGYREDFSARDAVPDIDAAEGLHAAKPAAMNLYRPLEAPAGTLRFKMVRSGEPTALSDSLPMLERMGLRVLDERPYRVAPTHAGQPLWIHDFGLARNDGDGSALDIDTLGPLFEDAFANVYSGTVENDGFNRLVLAARLSAEDIVVLRTYARYLRQLGFPLSQAFVESTLATNPAVARMLVSLFRLRLDPARADEDAAQRQIAALGEELDRVVNLNEDRVLRQLLALVLATTRTNFWRRDMAGGRRTFLSLKFDPKHVPGMPEPRPMFEIFVYSTRFEGVHLRGGKVARGGLRWSDRPEDFRTEVLGLVKAQMVKNTVIVPVGSKGGFVLKQAPAASEREAYLAEGIACYKDYLRGLLDVTDNLVAGKIVPPPDVHRRDLDDPYLVVAADKGTATFSDFANGVSKEYGFWLGDAFASGGSVGYDHKAMGITARGAWESVKRHFREMGVDTQTTDFTVVGIGDMSGDVFGNGMLLSRHIKLVAAFDHRHVFLDPAPDPERSFVERERMFGLPRSSWADYNIELISKGGGVWPRSAKSIPISPEMQHVLGIDAKSLPPTELLAAILRAPVDLLYNGGVGTYVKAETESHAEVGDRANDAVRANGRALRCKVVAEGGNLGLTQRGRVEYAQKGAGGSGGRIYTDAIDNSAGVDTSDHEVNLKILAGLAIAEGEFTEKQRDHVLAQMTDDVAQLVLRDNYFQTQALSLGGRIATALLEPEARFIRYLEKAGRLNRAIEFLPDEDEFARRGRAQQGLVAPERAVVLAYSKMWLYDEMLASDLPDDPWVATALTRYFPPLAREKFAGYLRSHPLRREIISTHVVNSAMNRVGGTFVHRLAETTGLSPTRVLRAYLLAREIFGLVPLWQAIEALDNRVPDTTQADMLLSLLDLTTRATMWFLRSRRLQDDMAGTIATFRAATEGLKQSLPALLDDDAANALTAKIARYRDTGVPDELARQVATMEPAFAALDIIEIAAVAKQTPDAVAAVHFELERMLSVSWLRSRIGLLPTEDHWQSLAKAAMADDVSALQRAIALQIFAAGAKDAVEGGRLPEWEASHREALERTRSLLAELRTMPNPDAAMLSVALRELRALA